MYEVILKDKTKQFGKQRPYEKNKRAHDRRDNVGNLCEEILID